MQQLQSAITRYTMQQQNDHLMVRQRPLPTRLEQDFPRLSGVIHNHIAAVVNVVDAKNGVTFAGASARWADRLLLPLFVFLVRWGAVTSELLQAADGAIGLLLLLLLRQRLLWQRCGSVDSSDTV